MMKAEDCCTTRSNAARSELNFAKQIVSTPTKSTHNLRPIGLSRPSSRPRDQVVHTSAYQIAEFSAPSDAEDAAQGGVAEAQRTLTTQKRVRWTEAASLALREFRGRNVESGAERARGGANLRRAGWLPLY